MGKEDFALMMEIFGDFIDNLPPSHEYLMIGFSPSSVPLKQRWRNNGLSADFLADYLTTFFPGGDESRDGYDAKAEVKSAVSFIANELLENAMKFNDEASHKPVSISLHLNSERLVFLVTNSINPQSVGKFQTFIEELTTSDPNELYIRHLEKNAEDENVNQSGLGFLTMIVDYQAKLGWKFESIHQEPEIIAVTTMVQLTV
jgi:hypothetical protein